MTQEELIASIQSSGLYGEQEAKQWAERIQKEGVGGSFVSELVLDTRRRVGVLLDAMGIVDENSPAYKEVMLNYYNELKGIGREYRNAEKQIEKEEADSAKEEAAHEAKKHIDESREMLTKARKS